MKHSDVKVGEFYAFTNSPIAQYSCHQVEVLRTDVTKTVGRYGSRRTGKAIEIRHGDKSWYPGRVEIIEARYLVRTWAEQEKKLARERALVLQQRAAAELSLQARDQKRSEVQCLTGIDPGEHASSFDLDKILFYVKAALAASPKE